MVSVSSEGNSDAFLSCQLQKRNTQILPIRIAVYLYRFIEPRCFRKYPAPIAVKAFPPVIDSRLGMSENLNAGISQGRDVTRGLMFLSPKGGMKTAQNQIELLESRSTPCAFAGRSLIARSNPGFFASTFFACARVRNSRRIGGGFGFAGGRSRHSTRRRDSEGPIQGSSSKGRPAANNSLASTGHMKAACAARRKALSR
jgi:hypothetical protein